jgi:thymidylate kinase
MGLSANQPARPDPAARLLAKRRQLRSPLARAGFVWLTALDLWLSNLRRVAWPLLRGQVVIADRYVLDAAAELGQILDHPAPGRLAAMRLLRALSPRPDVAYLLEVPPQVAACRAEGAEAEELLAAQAGLCRDLARSWGAQVVANDAPFEEVSARIVREVLRLYYRG